MGYFQFQSASSIISGLGSIAELKTILIDRDYQKVLLVTDPGMIAHQYHLPVIECLDAAQIDYVIFQIFKLTHPSRLF